MRARKNLTAPLAHDGPESAGFSRLDLLFTSGMLTLLALLNIAAVRSNNSGSQSAACLANLRQLTRAWQQYALDETYFPPNPDDGNTTPGFAWVPGEVGVGGAQQFNPDILQNPTRNLLWPYLGNSSVSVYRCPADTRMGRYQGSNVAQKGTYVPQARDYSMNQAVGTNPYASLKNGEPTAVDGPWLDNNHGHVAGATWRTYASFDDIVAPTPANLALIFDEDADSINDGTLAFGMARPEWIDWPATRHDVGGTISYADGHVELHHWRDPRTAVVAHNVSRLSVPGSADYEYLRERISAPFRP